MKLVKEEYLCCIVPVEAGDGLAAVRQVLGEQCEEAAVLGHRQRPRLRHIQARLLRRGRRAAGWRARAQLWTQPRLQGKYSNYCLYPRDQLIHM